MTNPQNKKVKMTKLLLKKSLFEYLAEKTITELNVRMICNKAQINRSTFYLHYKSIDDMSNSIKDEEISHFEKYIESIISTENEYQVCVGCLNYIKDNEFLFKVLFSGNYPDFEVDYVKCVSKYMNNNLLANQNIYESIFITAGCLHISKYWLDNGCIQPASEVAEQLLKIISKHL